MTALRHLIEAWMFAILMAVTRVLPRGVVRAIGRRTGDLGRLLDRRHHHIATENLALAFPDMDRSGRERIARKCWRHFGEVLLDTLNFRKLGPQAVGRIVHFEGLEHLEQACSMGRGVLVFTGHFGHWELMALMQGYLGYPMSFIARPLDNRRLETRLAALRERSGNTLVYKRSAVRALLQTIRDGRIAGILIDQDARHDGVFVPFFHRSASTTPTLALLAIRTGAPIVPFRSVPGPGGSWRIIYQPAVLADPEAERAAEVQRVTALCTSIIEEWIREHPELWLWMHRRWKTRPAPRVE
jgi:KDO2-lipid IV(A) lauroyltransferase